MALHLLDAIAPQEAPRPGGSVQAGGGRGGGGGDSSRKRTHSECESVPRNSSRHSERSRNWAEQRRDQPQPGTGPQFYRGSGNSSRGHGGYTGKGGGGGDDRSFQYSGGRRPYNRGWTTRGKRRNWTNGSDGDGAVLLRFRSK
jgi:hypothetical protein